MKKQPKYLILIVLFYGVIVNSQQLPQFTQYLYNTVSINPAYAGSRGVLNATALHRNQWSGLEGNPRTNTLSLHTPIRFTNVGVGITYMSDNLGFESTNYIYGDFSYSVFLNDKITMSFGLKGGVTSYLLQNPDPIDRFFSNDGTLWSPNFGAGIYVSSERWFLGISAPRILNTDLNEGEFRALERNSYYAISGIVLDLGMTLKFKPSIIYKLTDGAPATYDVSANFLLYNKLWLGATYRFNFANNIGAIIDYQVSREIRIGYAYDLPTSEIRPYSSATHEVLLIYEPSLRRKGGVKSPRYF
ncbi:MAG: type IX secretion system membrane protein PorP/SprF [Bacteroidota bacterium]